MERVLFVIRGLPGSGKSTLGNTIAEGHCHSADDYFTRDGHYFFDPLLLDEAHKQCLTRVEQDMLQGVPKIAAANTFTRSWEYSPYHALAAKHGYTVFSLIVENTHGGSNVHAVPQVAIDRMRERFAITL